MYLAVDIGVTKTLVALFSSHGRVVRRVKFPTAKGCRTFLDDLDAHLALFQKYEIQSVVVAVPGTVHKNYSVSFGNRSWGDIDLSTPIKNLFACPVYFENDANLAAVYEGYRLAGRTVFLTFSTGIGGGVVEKGRLLSGVDFEPGHKKYTYNGATKEWEDIAAASAIGRYYQVDAATSLRGQIIMQDIANRVYLGLPDIVEEFHPNTIVLGGPLGKIFRLYARYLPSFPGARYRRPKRPLESVIYGCYLYARQQEQG